MIVTVFRARLRPGLREEYLAMVDKMAAIAATMPGYISHKVFTADDGERVTIVEFADEESQRGWAQHPEHRAGQIQGRREFYSEYKLQVCEVKRQSEKKPG